MTVFKVFFGVLSYFSRVKIQSTVIASSPPPSARSSTPSAPSQGPGKRPDWREVTVNEVMVEIPQAGLDLFEVREQSPVLGAVAQSAVSSLAFLRAYQGLTGDSVEQKLEGASSLALGVGGMLSMVPGQAAAFASQGFLLTQSALEVGLGVRELHEEIFQDETPDWKEIVTGSLDVIKGGAAFVPLFFPSTADVSICVQSAALLAKAAFESTIRRSTDE